MIRNRPLHSAATNVVMVVVQVTAGGRAVGHDATVV